MTAFKTFTLAAARELIFAAETKAYRLGAACNIAVVDVTGHLIAYVRMDGAALVGAEQSFSKALNSVAVELTAKIHAERGLLKSDPYEECEAMSAAGGIAFRLDDKVVGGIGISSGHLENDHAIALAAIEAFNSTLNSDDIPHHIQRQY